MQERPHGAARVRPRPYVVWLIGAGALATVVGVVWVLIAFESAQQATTFSGPIPTLPVFTYAQYSQRDIVPDYTGLFSASSSRATARLSSSRAPSWRSHGGGRREAVILDGMAPHDSTARILAVCRVAQLRPDSGNVGVTAIDKQPVEPRLKVRTLGLYGDVQADRKHHGGVGKALYAYADEAADFWEAELGRAIPPGLFGENLRTVGVDVDGAEIGERWRIGDELVVEVTCPRTPCATFQRRMREPQWVRRFTEAGRVGAYLAVVHTGTVGAGDAVEVVRRPGHGVTIASWFSGADADQAEALLAAEADGRLELYREMTESIAKVRGRAA